MEVKLFDLQTDPVSEYSVDRMRRAARYLDSATTTILTPERPDYVEDIGRYFLSLAAYAEETDRPVHKRNMIEISRSTLELTDIKYIDQAYRVQNDVVERIGDIKRITFAYLEPVNRLPETANPTSYLDIIDMLANEELINNHPSAE